MTVLTTAAANGALQPDIPLAERLFAELERRTGTSRGITRASYGLGEQIAHDIVRREARALGLRIEADPACNLYVTLPGRRDAPAIYLGSHIDSVPLGGNFDGAAGVLAGLSVVAGFRKAGVVPERDVTVMVIRAEESTWFNASYIGSRAAFGRLAATELDDIVRANDGVSLGSAIAAAGGDTQALRRGDAWLDAKKVGMFVETHIEQGPLLLSRELPVGIVTSIRGSFRYRNARCIGVYAHSGATPREARHDALLAVADLIMRMDALWSDLAGQGEDLTVTFGQIGTDPGEAAFSKVPGEVSFSLDVRSASPETLDRVRARMARLIEAISEEKRVRFELDALTSSEPATMDRDIVRALGVAAEAEDVPVMTLPSGAGHDAAVFAQMGIPTSMLFIRNENGSHNPDEQLDMRDFVAATRVLSRFCLDVAGNPV